MMALLVALFVFMVMAGIVAVWTTDLLSAVIAVGAVGFGSSAAFVLLGAPDLAITQTVVEVLTLVILIRATIGRDVRTVEGSRDVFGVAVAAGLVLMLTVFAVTVAGHLPRFGVPAMDRVADAPSTAFLDGGLRQTGAGNIVTAILLDYRGYDTLGEATVIFTSVLGAMVLLRRRARAAGVREGER